ncbi:MAG: hypothetical protein JSU96_09745 [Acidobacteriota bacterium]|nr:MAG: hypothetical protein JSU96_09745 [Acidobacteriota bacterium]
MAYRCPVCKARLWQGPFLKRVECPRCGGVFKPTVPWIYFQALLFLFVVLSLVVVVVATGRNLWIIFLFLCIFALFFWFLPKLISLVHVPSDLTMVGPVSADDLDLGYNDWEDEEGKPLRFTPLYYFCILLIFALFTYLIFQVMG